jgi:hypothetical protein
MVHSTTLRMYYPSTAPPNPPIGLGQPVQGPIDFNAFRASLSNGLSTGLAAALMVAQQVAAPLQASKTKEDWTGLLQKQVPKIVGMAETADFATAAPAIWQEFVTEGKTADAFHGRFPIDTGNPDAPDIVPYISCWTAQDLIAGRFAPHDLTMEGSIYGLMPLAFMPRSGAEQHDTSQDNKDKERATYITTELVQAQWMVWTVLFYTTCPFVTSLNALWAELMSNKEALKDAMSPSNVASMVWSLSMAAHKYIHSPYNSQGAPRRPDWNT